MKGSAPNWLLAAAVGFGGVAVVVVTFFLIGSSVPVAIPLLLLLVPITGASVLADWRVSVPVAVVASTAYALAFLPPIGGVRIGLTHDVSILATFTCVSLIIGVLKSRGNNSSRETDAGRSLLLRGVSHNLRNPLNTIRTVSTALLDGGTYDDSTRREMLGLVADETERLDRIVGNLLSVSRVQAGALMPDLRAESVHDLVVAAAGRFARLDDHPVRIAVEDDLPEVLADAVQIDQVLTNLLDNAVRHTPPGTDVRIEADQDHDAIRIVIADDGPGIPDEVLRHRFQPIPRARAGSAGLGLAVAKAIVDAHGGTIKAGVGQSGGARVEFTLRLHDVHDRSRSRVGHRG